MNTRKFGQELWEKVNVHPTFRLYPSDSQYAVEKIINSYARGTQLKLLEFRGSNLSKVFASMCSVAQSCPTLWDLIDCSPSSSSVYGSFPEKIVQWVAISFSRGFSRPQDQPSVSCSSCIAGGFFTAEPPGKPTIKRKENLTGIIILC